MTVPSTLRIRRENEIFRNLVARHAEGSKPYHRRRRTKVADCLALDRWLQEGFAQDHPGPSNKLVSSAYRDFAPQFEALHSTPANHNDGQEPFEPFPDGWWASS